MMISILREYKNSNCKQFLLVFIFTTWKKIKIIYTSKAAIFLLVMFFIISGQNDIVSAGQWTQKSSGATVRADHAGVAYNNKMYIFAGRITDGSCLNDLWEYNLDTDVWIQKMSGASQRDCFSAAVYDGKIYIFGGNTCGTSIYMNDLWVYDIVSNSWTQKSSGATGRIHHTAVIYNEKMYIYGGKENGTNQTLKDLWAYDIATDTWQQKSDGPFATKMHSAVVYNGKMYVFGGTDDNSNSLYEYNFSIVLGYLLIKRLLVD